MIMQIHTLIIASVFLATLIGHAGCASEDRHTSPKAPGELKSVSGTKEFTDSFDASQLAYRATGFDSADAVWALAQCECSPLLLRGMFEASATSKGVLPQILIPTVREQVKGNPSLQTLQKIPLGGLLANFFASDEKIADSIRKGISDKIARTPGSSNLGERKAFRFDGFSPVPGQQSVFALSDQIPLWVAVFAADGVWSNGEKVDGTDHGLQTLLLLRTLSEWTYLIGLDKNSDGGFYGGLSLKGKDGKVSIQGPIDPRKDAVSWLVSGSYSLQYDESSARDLATSVKEVWKHSGDPVSLEEQAMLWYTAARAFARLRTDARANIQGLFSGNDPVLPAETHTLPLAFLTNIETLLPESFVDKEKRLIRAHASFGSGDDNPASSLATARLLRALATWSSNLATADKAGLDAATLKKVVAAPEEFKPAMQLSIQSILSRYTAVAADVGGEYGLAITDGMSPLTVGPAAEVLVALMDAEKNHLPSPFLRERILLMLDWFAGDVLGAMTEVSSNDVIWLATLARAATNYAPNDVENWAPGLQAFAEQQLTGGGP